MVVRLCWFYLQVHGHVCHLLLLLLLSATLWCACHRSSSFSISCCPFRDVCFCVCTYLSACCLHLSIFLPNDFCLILEVRFCFLSAGISPIYICYCCVSWWICVLQVCVSWCLLSGLVLVDCVSGLNPCLCFQVRVCIALYPCLSPYICIYMSDFGAFHLCFVSAHLWLCLSLSLSVSLFSVIFIDTFAFSLFMFSGFLSFLFSLICLLHMLVSICCCRLQRTCVSSPFHMSDSVWVMDGRQYLWLSFCVISVRFSMCFPMLVHVSNVGVCVCVYDGSVLCFSSACLGLPSCPSISMSHCRHFCLIL